MPATPTADRSIFDGELAPWKSRVAKYFDHLEDSEEEALIWDDWGVVEVLRRESDEQDQIRSALVKLLETSISGYLEILEFATDERLRSFAEVVVRQRAAQCEDVRNAIERERSASYFQLELTELEGTWRLAIWNLEQDRESCFWEYAERAEGLLEETLLTAAKAFRDEDWSQQMLGYAVAACGARSVWEELGQSQHDGISHRIATDAA